MDLMPIVDVIFSISTTIIHFLRDLPTEPLVGLSALTALILYYNLTSTIHWLKELQKS